MILLKHALSDESLGVSHAKRRMARREDRSRIAI